MKKTIYVILLAGCITPLNINAQIIFSEWENPSGKVSTTRNPDGVLCTTLTCPYIYNAVNVVDNDPNSYAQINFPLLNLATSVTITAELNGAAASGTNGGIMLRSVTDLLSLSVLPNITIELLNNNTVVGTQTNAALLNLSLLSSTGARICTQASSTYNKVRLTIAVPVGVGLPLQFQVYSAFGNSNTTCLNSVLPLELTAFSLEKNGHGVKLTWQTTAEINVSHFIIQRSVQDQVWKDIDRIAFRSANNSQHYQYIDHDNIASERLYRIAVVDNDGRRQFHPVKRYSSFEENQLRIFPTLVKNQLTVLTPAVNKAMRFTIVDMHGRQFPAPATYLNESAKINCHHLPSGIYILSSYSGNTVHTGKFMMQGR